MVAHELAARRRSLGGHQSGSRQHHHSGNYTVRKSRPTRPSVHDDLLGQGAQRRDADPPVILVLSSMDGPPTTSRQQSVNR